MKAYLTVLALCGVLCFASVVQAADKKIEVVNKAQFEICTLQVSPTNANQWQENVLEQRTLPSGDTLDLMMSETPNAAAWDVKVTDKQGNSVTWVAIPLTKAGQIELLPEGKFNAK